MNCAKSRNRAIGFDSRYALRIFQASCRAGPADYSSLFFFGCFTRAPISPQSPLFLKPYYPFVL